MSRLPYKYSIKCIHTVNQDHDASTLASLTERTDSLSELSRKRSVRRSQSHVTILLTSSSLTEVP
jgi:hypothetical protein